MNTSIGGKRLWQSGLRVRERLAGVKAVLIASYGLHAWVVFEGRTDPQTVMLDDLLDDEEPMTTQEMIDDDRR